MNDAPSRTLRRSSGDRAEALVAEMLRDAGWRIVGRQVPVDRDELDIIAIEPGSRGHPDMLVFVEVRSARDGRFGAPEESVVGRKVGRTFRAALALLHVASLPDGRPLPRLPWRVDVVAVVGLQESTSNGQDRAASVPRIRHLRAVDPG